MIEINFYNNYDAEYNQYQNIYESLALKTLNHLNRSGSFEVSVTLLNNSDIHKMNLDYRGKDYATDVITFENDMDMLNIVGIPIDLGDIFISVDKACEQAIAYKHSLSRELSFLFVHGLLHSLGYDHLDDVSEKEMILLQEEILDETYQRKTTI